MWSVRCADHTGHSSIAFSLPAASLFFTCIHSVWAFAWPLFQLGHCTKSLGQRENQTWLFSESHRVRKGTHKRSQVSEALDETPVFPGLPYQTTTNGVEVCPLTVLEARSGSRVGSFWRLPPSRGRMYPMTLFQLWVLASQSLLCGSSMCCSYLPPSSHGLSLSLFPLLFSYKDLSLDLGPTLIRDGLISRSLIISVNTLIPNKVVFSGSR